VRSFLQRVIDQRDLEQEQERAKGLPRCKGGCGEFLGEVNTYGFCTKCGGRKRARKFLEEHWASEPPELTPINFFPPTFIEPPARPEPIAPLPPPPAHLSVAPEVPMSEETPARTCSSCSKKLRRDNATDTCSACKKAPKTGARAAPRPAKAARTVEAPPADGTELERFKVVATALGFDPDELMATWAAVWLGQLREKVGAE
jgi:hypothetical protein